MNNILIAFIKDNYGYEKYKLTYLLTISLDVFELIVLDCYADKIINKDMWLEIKNGKIAIFCSLIIEDNVDLEMLKRSIKNIDLKIYEKKIEDIKRKINLQYSKQEDVFEDLMLTIARYEFQKIKYEQLISYSRSVKNNELFKFIYSLINLDNLVIL